MSRLPTTGLPGADLTRYLLVEVNVIRSKVGLPPVRSLLRGQRKEGPSCPLARTLACGWQGGVYVGGDYAVFDGTTMGLSTAARDFVYDFDKGRYPGLVLP